MHRPTLNGCPSPRDNLISRDDLDWSSISNGDKIDELDLVIEHHLPYGDDGPTHEKLASRDEHGGGFPHSTPAIPFRN